MFFKISVIAIASSQCASFGLSIPQYSAPPPTLSAPITLRDASGNNIPRAAKITVPALRNVNSDELPQLANLKRAASSFKHPGVFLDSEQLDFIKSMVNSEAQPWKKAYDSMLSSPLGSTTRTAKPTSTVECGPTSKPDHGCSDEKQDALAAYTMSLAWYISGSKKYAEKAIYYMNVWAETIKAHTNSNAPLQTGWSGSSWARAAEIIRHTYDGWSPGDIQKFEDMLRNVYLEEVIVGSSKNGNWDLVMMEAAQGISVFLEESKSYDKAMSRFMVRVPGYVYLTSDGPVPKEAPGSGSSQSSIERFWYGQSNFHESGIAQETCRDFVHTGYGLASISHVAETSRIQGNDLYATDIGTRLRAGLEFHSKLELGASKPDWLCNHSLKLGLGPSKFPQCSISLLEIVRIADKVNNSKVTEVGFNALTAREKNTLISTEKLTVKNRPAGTNNLFVAWETLTNAKKS